MLGRFLILQAAEGKWGWDACLSAFPALLPSSFSLLNLVSPSCAWKWRQEVWVVLLPRVVAGEGLCSSEEGGFDTTGWKQGAALMWLSPSQCCGSLGVPWSAPKGHRLSTRAAAAALGAAAHTLPDVRGVKWALKDLTLHVCSCYWARLLADRNLEIGIT